MSKCCALQTYTIKRTCHCLTGIFSHVVCFHFHVTWTGLYQIHHIGSTLELAPFFKNSERTKEHAWEHVNTIGLDVVNVHSNNKQSQVLKKNAFETNHIFVSFSSKWAGDKREKCGVSMLVQLWHQHLHFYVQNCLVGLEIAKIFRCAGLRAGGSTPRTPQFGTPFRTYIPVSPA